MRPDPHPTARHIMTREVTLLCPMCGRSVLVALDKTDPPDTARVETTCFDCSTPGDFEQVMYFDKSGKQLEPE
jgi:hypothetical protein